MKVLWLSGRILSADDNGRSGTWLQAMAQRLVESGEAQLGNITQGPVPRMVRQDHGRIQQWILPFVARGSRNRLPGSGAVAQIVKAVKQFRPDVIHVWGTEFFWGLLTARRIIQAPAVLLAKLFCGGLSFTERMACMGPKEWLRQSWIRRQQKEFKRWGLFEREIIKGHQNICAQSPWMEAQIKAINSSARIFSVDLVLREPFHLTEPWQGLDSHRIFYSAAYPQPYKGLHIAVRATAILKRTFPNIQLRIAGKHQRPGLRRDGYISWINREINRLGLGEHVVWLGPLNAAQIIYELKASFAMLISSFVESYSLALCEAMILGVPTVVSFTGGTAYLAKDEESSLFFPPGDAEMCAYQLARFFIDHELAKHLSQNARTTALIRHNPDILRQRQIEIYHTILENSKNT